MSSFSNRGRISMAEIDAPNFADENKLARPTQLTRTCRRLVNRAFLPFTYFSLIIPPKLRKFKPRTWFLGVLLMGVIVLVINVIQADENSDLFLNFGDDDFDDDLSSDTGFPKCRAEPHSQDLAFWQAPYDSSALCPSTTFSSLGIMEHKDQAYNGFVVDRSHKAKPFSLVPVTPTPAYCLDSHFEFGTPCPCVEEPVVRRRLGLKRPGRYVTRDNTPLSRMDMVWTWLNGSDPLHLKGLSVTQEQLGYNTSKPKLFREHDELRFSFRSAIQHFRHGINKFHLITSDTSASSDSRTHLRYGQLPQWFAAPDNEPKDSSNPLMTWTDATSNGSIQLEIRHHSQMFAEKEYVGLTFNSLGIETQFGRLCNVTENYLYMNNDFFLLSNVSTEDFHTTQFGSVFRFYYGLLLSPRNPSHQPPQDGIRALEYSNWLLSDRFGVRKRPWVPHVPYVISLPIMHEMSTGMWHEQFKRTAGHPFRGSAAKDFVKDTDDVHPGFLLPSFTIERAREALLWSFIVGRVGGSGTLPGGWWENGEYHVQDVKGQGKAGHNAADDDSWSPEVHGRRAWDELGGSWGQRSILVSVHTRDTLDRERIDLTANTPQFNEDGEVMKSMNVNYTWSSMDGYPYSFLKPSIPGFPPPLTHGTEAKPNKTALPACVIEWDECFFRYDQPLRSASEVFVNVAFEKIACGDCMIRALIDSSGPLGISKFLPAKGRTVPVSTSPPNSPFIPIAPPGPPHLPLTTHWDSKDFTLGRAMEPWAMEAYKRRGSKSGNGVNVREWTMMVIQRYRYIIGDLPFSFISLKSGPTSEEKMFGGVEKKKNSKMLCINDDIKDGDDVDNLDNILQGWFKKRWSTPANWERKQ